MKRFLLAGAFALALCAPAFAQSDLNPATGTYSNLSERAGIQNLVNAPTKWTYAAASGGIVDTTAVTLKTAAGVGKKNYLGSIQLANSGAAATEVIIRKGAAGTVIWRGWVGATAPNHTVTFRQPLESDANQLLEVVLSSSTTVAVRVNAQGWTD